MNQSREVVTAPYVHETEAVESTELAVRSETTLFGTTDPVAIIARASEAASALAGVIRKKGLYKKIGPKEHVFVEGWTLCGSMLGVFPVCVWTRPIRTEGSEENLGWEARVEARNIHGAVVGAAEAQCLYAERNWKDRDDFALRSMAQTRATSKALRMPLGFVLTLAGYSATPAEEMSQDATPEAPEEEVDLTPALKASIAKVEAEKAARLAAVSPEVAEMLRKAEENRKAIQEDLNGKSVEETKRKLQAAGFEVEGVCEKCGNEIGTYTAKAGHRFAQCSAARKSKAVFAEGGHAYKRLSA